MFCKTARGAMSFLGGHWEGLTKEDTDDAEIFYLKRYRNDGCLIFQSPPTLLDILLVL
jgi:hypothetical protein